MRLYICRHGKAERNSPTGADEDRPLKDKGRRQAAHLGETLARSAPRPVVVVASPVLRAKQTADGILEHLQAERRDDERLSTSCRVGDVLDLIHELAADLPSDAGAVLVGHNPDLSIAASTLIHGPASHGSIALRTGQCIAFDIDPANPVGSGDNVASFRME